MGMTRGGQLVADIAAVVKLTAQQDLAHLETGGELDFDDVLVTANDWVYDKLERVGDPTALSNQTRYERAVAWYALSVAAETGYLPGGTETPGETAARYLARAKESFDEVWPRFASADDPGGGGEGIPAVRNVSTDPLFGSLT